MKENIRDRYDPKPWVKNPWTHIALRIVYLCALPIAYSFMLPHLHGFYGDEWVDGRWVYVGSRHYWVNALLIALWLYQAFISFAVVGLQIKNLKNI